MPNASMLAAALLAASAALAQEPPAPGPPPPPPPPAANPAMQAAREQVRSQCAADFQKFCPDAQGPARMQCMRDHAAEMSDGCKTAMQAMMAARSGG